MFFSGRMDGQGYAAAAARRNGLLAAAVLALPHLPLVPLSAVCKNNGSVCMGLAYGIFFLSFPLFFIGLSLSFVPATARRFRDAGLPSLVAFALPLLFLTDAPWLVGRSISPQKFNSAGTGIPVSLLFALAMVATLSVVRPASAAASPDETSPRPQLSVVPALVAIALIPAAVTIVYAVVRSSFLALAEAHQFRGGSSDLRPLTVMLMTQAAALGLVAVGYREWRNQGSFGSGTGWLAAVAACVAIIALGGIATIVRVVTMGLATIWGLKTSMMLAPGLMAFVHWIVLAELLALLILPWLLSNMPRDPVRSPANPAGGPHRLSYPDPRPGRSPSPAAGAVPFGRRSPR